MADQTVAKTILEQLGGNRFAVMTGAKNFVSHADGLSFKLPSTPHFTKSGINFIKITLNQKDLYNVEFGKLRGLKYTKLSQVNDVYDDGLRRLISVETGLALSL
jgi:hypothetical protein